MGRDGENVRYGLWVHETVGNLFLCHDDARVLAAEGDSGQSRGGGGGFEGVFHLVEASLGGEDGYVVIIVAIDCRLLFVVVVVVVACNEEKNVS